MKFFIWLLILPSTIFAQSLVQYVDPLIGTAPATTESARKHSEAGSEMKGQTFPGVGRPFGMTQWTPETRTTEDKCISPYYYNDRFITGFRGTHWMSGSCTQDYGSATLMPFSTDRIDTLKSRPFSRLKHKNEVSAPAYYNVLLEDFGINAELTGSVRSGMMRLNYPYEKESYLYLRVNSDKKKGKIWVDKLKNEILGYNPVFRIYQGSGKTAGFSGYFVIQFDQPFKEVSQIRTDQQLVVSFGRENCIKVRIGTSFTSVDAARKNLKSEIVDWDFDKLSKVTEAVWNHTLGKIQVKNSSHTDLVKFYTALYHCYQLPRIASDVDGSYQGFAQDTLIHKAVGFDYYDDFSMWDTYRALHPLMTILEPKRSLDMVKSLVAKAQQGGWMPIFPAWGSYTAAMIGDHVSTMISDAYLRGITEFDIKTAYQLMRQNAFDQPKPEEYKDGKGRRALPGYLQYGYIPLEDSVWEAFHKREQVSRTLEYALDDYALSQFAKRLGKTEDYNVLLKRSKNYTNVIDPSTGYARGRYADGKWIGPFNPLVKANYITEGTPFQYTWYVPQDVPGLIAMLGGKSAFIRRLNEFFDGNYYWHGNETDQQAPYLYALAGEPAMTAALVQKIVDEEYGTGPGGLSGNEDAGQMSAWLVCSMIGFYPVCPGKPEYVIGVPAFDEVQIKTINKAKPFTIRAIHNNSKSLDIKNITLNGLPFQGVILQHSKIVEGGEMIFQSVK
ncbi:MAG: GH92 family glycosyl hydrolase [Bacteroidia bacterium]|nr:GH92 family glycosyl hydrolase [Bacteroidia bacterium]